MTQLLLVTILSFLPGNFQHARSSHWPFTTASALLQPSGKASGTTAQSITVKNFINPDAPLVRESLAMIEGQGLTNETISDPVTTPTTLGGVIVYMNGVPQRIRSVSPTAIVFIIDAAGPGSRDLTVQTKADGSRRTQIEVVNAWPGVIVQSVADDDKAYLALGVFIADPNSPIQQPISNSPVPVGQQRQTLVTVNGSGMRFASSIQVRLNGVPCQVVGVVPSSLFPGQDDLVFLLPPFLANVGAVDLGISIGGREANYSRLLLGAPAN